MPTTAPSRAGTSWRSWTPEPDVLGNLDSRAQQRIGDGLAEGEADRENTRPHVQQMIFGIVGGGTGPALHRSLVQAEREDDRGRQLLLVRLPRGVPLPRRQPLG